MDALAYPFRFSRGRAVRLDDASDEYAAQCIAALIRTRPAEIVVRPSFGVADPTFERFDATRLYFGVANFFPDIAITDVSTELDADGRTRVAVQFTKET